MRIILSILLIETFIGIFAWALAINHTPKGDTAITINSIVHVQSSVGSCTGFVVGRSLIATAGHCVEAAATGQVIVYDNGATRPYKIVAFVNKKDCVHDWALVMADTGNLPPLPLGNVPQSPQLVFRVGYGPGAHQQLAKARYLTGTFPGEAILSGSALHGESGSPVFDSEANTFAIVTCSNDVITIASLSTDIRRLVLRMQRGQ